MAIQQPAGTPPTLIDIIDLSNLKAVMTPDEVAQVLRCNSRTVYRLVARKQLPGVKVGSRVRVTRRALLAFLNLNMEEVS